MSFGSQRGTGAAAATKKKASQPPQKQAAPPQAQQVTSQPDIREDDTLVRLANLLGDPSRSIAYRSWEQTPSALTTSAISVTHDVEGQVLTRDPLQVAAGWTSFSIPDFASSLSTSSSILDRLDEAAGRSSHLGGTHAAVVLDARSRPVLDDTMVRKVFELSARAEQHRTLLLNAEMEVGSRHDDENNSDRWHPPTVEIFTAPPRSAAGDVSGLLNVSAASATPRTRSTSEIVSNAENIRKSGLRRFGMTFMHRPFGQQDRNEDRRADLSVGEMAIEKPLPLQEVRHPSISSRAPSERSQRPQPQAKNEKGARDVAVPDKQAYVTRILAGTTKSKSSNVSASTTASASKGAVGSAAHAIEKPAEAAAPTPSQHSAPQPQPSVADSTHVLHHGTSLFRPDATSPSPSRRQDSSRGGGRPGGSTAQSSDGGSPSVKVDNHASSLVMQHKLAATVDRLADEIMSIKQHTKTIQQQLVEQQLREQAGFVPQRLQLPLAPSPFLVTTGNDNAGGAQHAGHAPLVSREDFFAHMNKEDDAEDALGRGAVSAATSNREHLSTVHSVVSARSVSTANGGDGGNLNTSSSLFVIPPAPSFDVIRLENLSGQRGTLTSGAAAPQGPFTLADIAEGRTILDADRHRASTAPAAFTPSHMSTKQANETKKYCLELLSKIDALVKEDTKPPPPPSSKQRIPPTTFPR